MIKRMVRLFPVLFVCACAATQQKTTEDLMDSARAYEEGLRWRHYDDAAAHRRPAEREEFLDARDELDEDLRIDDYEIERVKFRNAHKEAILQVKFTWHLDSVGVVHNTTVEQAWERAGKMWLMVDEKRKRGEPMPGVAEKPKRRRAEPAVDEEPAAAVVEENARNP